LVPEKKLRREEEDKVGSSWEEGSVRLGALESRSDGEGAGKAGDFWMLKRKFSRKWPKNLEKKKEYD